MKFMHYAAAVSAAALLAGCGFGGASYPDFADAQYRIEGAASNPDGSTLNTTVYRDGSKMRVETDSPTGVRTAIVFDEATNAAYVLQAAQAPAVAPAVAPAAAPGAAPATAPAGAPPTPAPAVPPGVAPVAAPASFIGVAVRVADADAPQPLETSWAALGEDGARHVGKCEVAGEDGHEWRPREETGGVARTACITDDGIVLRVAEGDRVIFQATRLERGAQDPSLFGVPAGYQLVDPQAVVEQVGETMQHLDSVTGAPTTAPPPAPAPATPPG